MDGVFIVSHGTLGNVQMLPVAVIIVRGWDIRLRIARGNLVVIIVWGKVISFQIALEEE